MSNKSVDSKTMDILQSAMSAQAALNSMGYGMENEEFAREMAERDAKLAKKRADAATGGMVSSNAVKQSPITGRKRRSGMAVQDSSIPQVIAPSQASLDDQPGMDGITADQQDIINAARAMVGRAEESFKTDATNEFRSEQEAAEAVANGWRVNDGWDTVPTDAERQFDPEPAEERPYTPAVLKNVAAPAPKLDTATTAVKQMPEMHVQEVVSVPFNASRPDRDFNSFAEIKGFPSFGLAYRDRIYGQSLKLLDMFILTYMDEYNGSEMLDTIFSRHIRGIRPEDILSCDELYLMHWLRASSYPKSGMYGPRYVCKNCKFDVSKSEQANYTIGFNDLVFTTSADPAAVIAKHAEKGHVEIRTYDDRECHIYLRRRRHDREIADAKRAWEAEHHAKFPKYYGMAITMAAVVEIEGCDGILEKMDYIGEYPTSERMDFINAITESSLSTTVKARVTCPNCGGVAEWPYPFRVKNFLSGL